MSHYTLDRPMMAKAASFRSISTSNPFWFGNLIHLYVEISLGLDLEGAESISNARKAHEYIRKAADASFLVAEAFNGQVLEIHGRTLHLGFQYDYDGEAEAILDKAAGLLHILLKRAYGSGGPRGWQMAADHDATLTITSVGIHNDTSLVSLSPAANYPAKQLGRKAVPLWQLGANANGVWKCRDLDSIADSHESFALAARNEGGRNLLEEVMVKRARAINLESLSSVQQVNFQAAPVGTPTTENLYSCYGYVLSMDLDGFTKRVAEVANGTLDEQRQLAEAFYSIMEKSAKFAEDHPEWFIQFPFAGDNAIFAVTAEYLSDFEALKRVKAVAIAVEWEDQMGDRARQAGFGGWGQAAAGGETPHGNSRGNLHVSGIVLGERRYLVGIGPGMRFARQAFVQVDPAPTELAMYRPNVTELHSRLRMEFSDCPSDQSENSSYYKKAELGDLKTALKDIEDDQKRSVNSTTTAPIALKNVTVSHRPHCA